MIIKGGTPKNDKSPLKMRPPQLNNHQGFISPGSTLHKSYMDIEILIEYITCLVSLHSIIQVHSGLLDPERATPPPPKGRTGYQCRLHIRQPPTSPTNPTTTTTATTTTTTRAGKTNRITKSLLSTTLSLLLVDSSHVLLFCL